MTTPLASRLHVPRLQLAALAAFVLALLWTGTLWEVAATKREALERESVRTAALARAFAEHARGSFRRIDALLLTLRQRWEEDPLSFAAEVRRQAANLADISTLVSVSNAEGRMVFNSLDATRTDVSIADREHFQALRDATADALFISRPLLGKVSGRWNLFFSRRLVDRQERFAGTVVVAVDPRYYARLHERLALGAQGVIAMVRDGGDFLSRYPGFDGAMGTRLAGAPFLDPRSPDEGTFRRIGQVDGVDRIYGYERLRDFGVTVSVGQSVEEALAPVVAQARVMIAIALAGTGLLVLLTWAIDRGMAARARAEEAARRLAAELERRVEARTAQLTAANRELEAFAYSVSHDLKAPLRGIEGYSRLLATDHAGSLDAEGREFLANVRTATARMNEIIDDLLAYSRIERGERAATAVRLDELVGDIVAEQAPAIRERGAAVTLAVPAVQAVVDAQGLAMAIRNLLDNALKFTRGVGAPAITVGGAASDGRAHLWVRDNGVGFDMQYHDRLFAMFQRLNRVEDYPGTGIGLAIERKAMERLDGRAWAEGEPGRGATFHLEFPLEPPTQPQA